MKSIRTWMHAFFLVAAAVWVVGCPSNVGVFIVASPDVLDFGFQQNTLTFEAAKGYPEGHPAVLTFTSLDPWIIIEPPCDPGVPCASAGPLDRVRVTVRIDRSLLEIGRNEGQIRVAGPDVVPVLLTVRANSLVAVDFGVSTRTPFEEDPVTFTDLTETEPGWTVTSWLWDFGDGKSSTRQTPVPHPFMQAGLYDVSLTVITTKDASGETRSVTVTRPEYIVALDREPPAAAFNVLNPHVLANNMVWFEDVSTPGTAPITAWRWEFGDGAVSTEQNPSHVYASPGVYTVSLRATSLHGSATATQAAAVTVVADGPEADFRASDPTPPVNREMQFFDESSPGTAPITAWLWNFGDGAMSTAQNPVHVYRTPGTYSVTLTVTTAHGADSVTKPGYIDARVEGPRADFEAVRPVLSSEEPVRFRDLSDSGSFDVFAWEWDFGDGLMSNQPEPSHTYAEPGVYSVSLRVQTQTGIDTEIKNAYITILPSTPLDVYVHTEDPAYQFTLGNYQTKLEYSLRSIAMDSLTWRAAEATPALWRHKISVVTPHVVTMSKIFLFVTTERVGDVDPFPTVDPTVAEFAVQAQAIVAVLYQSPNGSIRFTGEETPKIEHGLAAYSLDRYLATGDDEWPVLLPMTKSIVHALDTVEAYFLAGHDGGLVTDGFVVGGGGLNGWAAWLAAAVDGRVHGVVPMAWDMLNMQANLDHQNAVYGDGLYAPGWSSYVGRNIFPRLDSALGQNLLGIIDPYAYRERLTMPKLIINATGDQFFPPDSARFYFDALPGEKHLMYEPNTSNSLGGYDNVLEETLPWFTTVASGGVLPSLDVTYTPGKELMTITALADRNASQGLFWTATSQSADFSIVGGMAGSWATTEGLSSSLNRQFEAPLRTPSLGWRAGYVEVLFPSTVVVRDGTPIPFRFDSQVRLMPDLE